MKTQIILGQKTLIGRSVQSIILLYAITIVLSVSLGFFQSSYAQNFHERPLQKLIDCPTAGGPIMHGWQFELNAFANEGLLFGIDIGLFPRFTVGVSYGGTGIIGFAKPAWNPQPGLNSAYRLLNESITFPAVAIGYNNQGRGFWDEDLERYQYIAKGFYGVASKNFILGTVGELSAHLGVNNNPSENKDKGIDAFIGFDYRMTNQTAIVTEYSFAWNDFKGGEAIGKGKGYLNSGFRWAIGRQFAIDFIFRDILVNQDKDMRGGKQIGREIRIHYLEMF